MSKVDALLHAVECDKQNEKVNNENGNIDIDIEANGLRNEIDNVNAHGFASLFDLRPRLGKVSLALPIATTKGTHKSLRAITPTAAEIALTIKEECLSSVENIAGIDSGEESSCYITADEGEEEEEIIFLIGNTSSSSSSSSSSVSTNSVAESSVQNWDDIISFEEGWKGIVANNMIRSMLTSASTSLVSSSQTSLSNDDSYENDENDKKTEENKYISGNSFASDEAIIQRNRSMLGATVTYNTEACNSTDDDESIEDSPFLLFRHGLVPEIEITFFGQNSDSIMAITTNEDISSQLKDEKEGPNVVEEVMEGKTEPGTNRNIIESSIMTLVLPTESAISLSGENDNAAFLTEWKKEEIDGTCSEDEDEGDFLLSDDNSEEEEEILIIFEDDFGYAEDTDSITDYQIISDDHISNDDRNYSSSWMKKEILDDKSNCVVTAEAAEVEVEATIPNSRHTTMNKVEKVESQSNIQNRRVEKEYGDFSNRFVTEGENEGEKRNLDHHGNVRKRSYITMKGCRIWDTIPNERKLHRLTGRSNGKYHFNIDGNNTEGRREDRILDEETYNVKNMEYAKGFSDKDREYWDQQEQHRYCRHTMIGDVPYCHNRYDGDGNANNSDTVNINEDADANTTNAVILGRKGRIDDDDDDDDGTLATLRTVEEGSYGKADCEKEWRAHCHSISFFGDNVVDPKQFLWIVITIVFVVCFMAIYCVILYDIVI